MKISRYIKWAIIVIATAPVTLFVILAILFFFPGNADHVSSRSVSDYGQFIEKQSPEDCMLFPEESLLSDDNCLFYYEYRFDGSNTPEFLSYVLCSFPEDVFYLEINRLNSLSSEYSEKYFNMPAYILYLNYVGYNQYALVDQSNRTIHYISFSSDRFADQIPTEDRIKEEFKDVVVQINVRDGSASQSDGRSDKQ